MLEEFEGELLSGHQENAVEVPFDPAKEWGIPAGRLWNGRNGHHVHGSINGIHFESVIVPRAKRFFVLIREEIGLAPNIAVGDKVAVFLEPLTVPGEDAR